MQKHVLIAKALFYASFLNRNQYEIWSSSPRKQSEILEVKTHWFRGASDKATESVPNTGNSEWVESELLVSHRF